MILKINTLVDVNLYILIFIPILLVVGGFIAGFFLARHVIKKYLDKNPPINENMIRAMMQQMGRTPSEKQVRAVMREMEANKTKKK